MKSANEVEVNKKRIRRENIDYIFGIQNEANFFKEKLRFYRERRSFTFCLKSKVNVISFCNIKHEKIRTL